MAMAVMIQSMRGASGMSEAVKNSNHATPQSKHTTSTIYLVSGWRMKRSFSLSVVAISACHYQAEP
jgi:hypothetical protein